METSQSYRSTNSCISASAEFFLRAEYVTHGRLADLHEKGKNFLQTKIKAAFIYNCLHILSKIIIDLVENTLVLPDLLHIASSHSLEDDYR